MEINGKNIIGNVFLGSGENQFQAINPTSGAKLSPLFYDASIEEINLALEVADTAFTEYRQKTSKQVVFFFEKIIENIEKLGDVLIDRAVQETALARDRLEGERTRMINQIRMFEDEIKEGSWIDARIDRAQADRKPFPKPDIRQINIPIGPVVVFSACSFPFAFSVAGGDTISALAAKNPVIVKTHPNHPGTSEMVAKAILYAIQEAQMPEGIFSMIHGKNYGVGLHLVRHPMTCAVAFTGTLSGGRALFDAAVSRPKPIPFYAEMSSVNPIFVLPEAMKKNCDSLAETILKSVTLGVGQYCTNPGLVVAINNKDLDIFIDKLADLISKEPMGSMLYSGIFKSYEDGIRRFLEIPNVTMAGVSLLGSDSQCNRPAASLMVTDGKTFLQNRQLSKEVFGPSTLIVKCETEEELLNVAKTLEGQLTTTLYIDSTELNKFRVLILILENKAGRLLWGGTPTGVEVCPSMFHGGPYPATTDIRSTSVGTLAMKRFLRPVCFQNFSEDVLPLELQNKNYRGIWRLIDNVLTRDDCH